MATVFWDRTEVLMVEFIQQETTITSQVYSETLKNCVGSLRTKGGDIYITTTALIPYLNASIDKF
jgi:intergrase/recombinase